MGDGYQLEVAVEAADGSEQLGELLEEGWNDFLGGEEGYELQFATAVRELTRAQVFAPTGAREVERALRAHARRVLATLRSR